MDRGLDNANPTILNAAQLPTRRNKAGASFKGPESLYEEIVTRKPSYMFPPYSAPDAWTFDDEDSSDGQLTEEPIDEQEIYGESESLLSQLATHGTCRRLRAFADAR